MRAPLLAALAFAFAPACEDRKDDLPAPPTTGRSNAVAAAADAATPATASAPTAHPSEAPGPPRQLCNAQAPRPAPKGALKNAAAPGVAVLPPAIPFGAGKWIWVNLWAAWCGPCKEEMPRLLVWQKKLRDAGVLLDMAFVSLDDDDRQFQRFLETQPATGVRASYWLPEGGGRTAWLTALGVKDPPDLPVQALVNPAGQISCLIQGAVEERDYPAIAAHVGAKH